MQILKVASTRRCRRAADLLEALARHCLVVALRAFGVATWPMAVLLAGTRPRAGRARTPGLDSVLVCWTAYSTRWLTREAHLPGPARARRDRPQHEEQVAARALRGRCSCWLPQHSRHNCPPVAPAQRRAQVELWRPQPGFDPRELPPSHCHDGRPSRHRPQRVFSGAAHPRLVCMGACGIA